MTVFPLHSASVYQNPVQQRLEEHLGALAQLLMIRKEGCFTEEQMLKAEQATDGLLDAVLRDIALLAPAKEGGSGETLNVGPVVGVPQPAGSAPGP